MRAKELKHEKGNNGALLNCKLYKPDDDVSFQKIFNITIFNNICIIRYKIIACLTPRKVLWVILLWPLLYVHFFYIPLAIRD